MFVCVQCREEMRCDKNGVGVHIGHGYVYAGDRWKCYGCGAMIISTNREAIHDPNLSTQEEYLNMPTKQ